LTVKPNLAEDFNYRDENVPYRLVWEYNRQYAPRDGYATGFKKWDNQYFWQIVSDSGKVICREDLEFEGIEHEEAKRLVAALNFARGIPTHALEEEYNEPHEYA